MTDPHPYVVWWSQPTLEMQSLIAPEVSIVGVNLSKLVGHRRLHRPRGQQCLLFVVQPGCGAVEIHRLEECTHSGFELVHPTVIASQLALCPYLDVHGVYDAGCIENIVSALALHAWRVHSIQKWHAQPQWEYMFGI